MCTSKMSFSWPTSTAPTFVGIKPTTSNSFADALKRLAEHVEEKNKHNTNNGGTSSLVQTTMDFPHPTIPYRVNNSTVSTEQALRLYAQYIHEAERREEMRRRYLRIYGGSNNPNTNVSVPTRRLDATDPYRFMTPNLSNITHPPTYLQLLASPPVRPTQPPQLLLQHVKSSDTTTRITAQEQNIKGLSEPTSQLAKPKSKLFRPYDLDNSNMHKTSPSSLMLAQKSTPSPSASISNTNTTLSNESQRRLSSGKEKQLFNSLGLVQQAIDVPAKDLFLMISNERFISSETTTFREQDNHKADEPNTNITDCSLSSVSKRKSACSSHVHNLSSRKQAKVDKIHHTMS